MEMSRESTESTLTINGFLSRLRMLRELEIANESSCEDLLKHLQNFDAVPSTEFEYLEPVLAQRFLFVGGGDQKSATFSKLLDLSLDYVNLCRESGLAHLGQRRLESLKSGGLLKPTSKQAQQIQLEESILLWESDEKEYAQLLINDLHRKLMQDSEKR